MSAVHTIAQGTMAQALAATPTKGTQYFDLREQLNDLIVTPSLRARVLSSMAWRIDTQIIGLARGLFYDMFRDSMETGTIDSFNEFIASFDEQEDKDEHSFDVGFEQRGSLKVMVSLLNMSKFWHDAAGEAAQQSSTRYVAKSLHQLLLEEKVQPVSKLTEANLALIAKHAARGDEKREAITRDLLIAREIDGNERTHAGRQKIMPAVLRIIDMAQKHGGCYANDTSDEQGFWTLPRDTQIMLITFAAKCTETSLMQLAKSFSTLEYAGVITEAFAAIDELKAVIASPKFTAGQFVESEAHDVLLNERINAKPDTYTPVQGQTVN